MDKGLLTVMEAADYLSCGRTKVFELLRAGDLRVVRLGRATRIPRRELDAWIAQQSGRLHEASETAASSTP
jgi:excisionase family DNA binding protein